MIRKLKFFFSFGLLRGKHLLCLSLAYLNQSCFGRHFSFYQVITENIFWSEKWSHHQLSQSQGPLMPVLAVLRITELNTKWFYAVTTTFSLKIYIYSPYYLGEFGSEQDLFFFCMKSSILEIRLSSKGQCMYTRNNYY